jgi:hypothetical protein
MFAVRPSRAFLAVAIALFTAACSGSPVAPTIPPIAIPGLPTAGSALPPATGHVGDTLRFASFDRAEIDATLAKIFDPATPTDANTSRPSGAHWVGVEMIIVNNDTDLAGQQSILDATSSDGSLLTTDQDYHGVSTPIGDFQGCTNNPEEMDAVQGQPYTNCKAFVVPNGESLKQVGIRVGGAELFLGQVSADQATWSVP